MSRSRPISVYGDAEALYDLGERMREKRIGMDISQANMARLAGCSRKTVSKIEGGDDSVAIGTVARVLGILGVASSLPDVIPEVPPTGDFAAIMQSKRRMRVRSNKR